MDRLLLVKLRILEVLRVIFRNLIILLLYHSFILETLCKLTACCLAVTLFNQKYFLQMLIDGIICCKVSVMTSELRKVDKKLALFTNDERVYHCFYKWHNTLYKVPYIQRGKMVGVDLYFDKQVGSTVRQVIKGQLLLDV